MASHGLSSREITIFVLRSLPFKEEAQPSDKWITNSPSAILPNFHPSLPFTKLSSIYCEMAVLHELGAFKNKKLLLKPTSGEVNVLHL
jgi:hypothetical protein